MYRHSQYRFPAVAIDPGKEVSTFIEVKELFRGRKLLMVGAMNEIRGSFWIKHSRLPRLDRRNVVTAYSRVVPRRYGKKKEIKFARGKTVVQYADAERSFTREYKPSSVVYLHTDPLAYIQLRNFFIGAAPQMPRFGGGAPASYFAPNALSDLLVDTAAASTRITMLLKNVGDIQVRVYASIMGTSRG